LGTLVLGAPFRHPSLLAKTVAALDSISEGRIDLGVGAGWLEDEFTAFGYRYGTVGERFAALEETLRVLEALLDGSEASGTFRVGRAEVGAPAAAARAAAAAAGVGGRRRSLAAAARRAPRGRVERGVAHDAHRLRRQGGRRRRRVRGRGPRPGLVPPVGRALRTDAEDEASVAALWERARASMPGRALDAESWEDWRADTLSGTPEQCSSAWRRSSRWASRSHPQPVVAAVRAAGPEMLDVVAERVIAPLR
jgi:alkanesulfonate monooxygenase SsuD/methylene tetrahydromethanopterin reductase-like flavin-dependent oxidoreductase (luciferase family)